MELSAHVKAFSEKMDHFINGVQRQIDAIDRRTQGGQPCAGGGFGSNGLLDKLKEDDSFQRLCRDKKGSAIINLTGDDCRLLERKSTLLESGVGFATTGVMPIERMAGIVPEARQTLFLRNLLTSRPTEQAIIDFVKVDAGPKIASPQTEGSDKGENAVTFTSVSEKVQTIATWIPASRQVLDDLQELSTFIGNTLSYCVDLEEERELLFGAGTTDLHGLYTQAVAFDTTLLPPSAGWNRIDILGAICDQLSVSNEIPPTFAVLNPVDWGKIRRIKDSFGRYILGDPGSMGRACVWNLDIVASGQMPVGDFLIGTGNPVAAEIRDRMTLQIEVSTSHSDYFAKNLVAVRAEKRLALIVRRPASFIKGSFTTSP
jgi:HK97 family phage major capsid protein